MQYEMMADSVVKSAARTLAILELFSQKQEPLTAKQVEIALSYPSSSTIMLLKSLNELGYLRFDRLSRTYLPTMRVAMLGNWMKTSALASDIVLQAAQKLHDKVHETIFVSSPNDTVMQTVYFIPGRLTINLNITLDFTIDMVNSAAGLAYLSTLSPAQVDEIIERTNRNRRGRPKYEPEAVHDKVDAVRRQGYASVYDVISAVGSITMAIPSPYSETQHVLGIGGFSERVKASEGDYVKQLKSAINGIKRAIKSDHK